jgi:dUTP pyrophosphatase
MTTLKMFRINPKVVMPRKQTAQSACFDLSFQGYGKVEYSGYTRMNKPFSRVMNNQIVIGPGDRVMVPTGLIMDIPKGYSVRLHARSGSSLKQGLVLANAEGVIDSDYVEEVMILLHNVSDNSITIQSGDRIAQAELVVDVEYDVAETASRPGMKTNRTGGMGSTGITTTEENGVIVITVPEYKIPKNAKSIRQAEEERKKPKRGPGRPKKDAGSTSR